MKYKNNIRPDTWQHQIQIQRPQILDPGSWIPDLLSHDIVLRVYAQSKGTLALRGIDFLEEPEKLLDAVFKKYMMN